jgi:hypothetical protein
VYQRGRGGMVVDEVLGEEFEGVLTSDFYAGYNHVACFHQRCWAHLLRDVKKLVLVFPDYKELEKIKKKISWFFIQAKEVQQQLLKLEDRHTQRRKLEKQLLRFTKPYLKDKIHPFHTLAKRIDYFIDELFTFMLDPTFDPTNNPAERAIRHQVIKRKISGGTRSSKGSHTQEVLTTLFSTWTLNKHNPFTECQKLLTNPNYSANFIQDL